MFWSQVNTLQERFPEMLFFRNKYTDFLIILRKKQAEILIFIIDTLNYTCGTCNKISTKV